MFVGLCISSFPHFVVWPVPEVLEGGQTWGNQVRICLSLQLQLLHISWFYVQVLSMLLHCTVYFDICVSLLFYKMYLPIHPSIYLSIYLHYISICLHVFLSDCILVSVVFMRLYPNWIINGYFRYKAEQDASLDATSTPAPTPVASIPDVSSTQSLE